MRIRVCIVTMTPELAYDAANRAVDMADGPVEVLLASNCCKLDAARFHSCVRLGIFESEDNDGVVPQMHRLWEEARKTPASLVDARDDILVYIHDDCQILEKGWDGRVISIMSTQPACDAIGFVGGTGIGAADIYQSPYAMIQLGRHNVHSNLVDAESHGARATGPMLLATADGCALILRRSFLDEMGGWSSWWPEPNHGYDNALACELRRRGRQLWLLPVRFAHPSPLKFTTPPNIVGSQRYVARFGTDQEVHARAHQRLYDTYRDVLPFHVS